MVERLRPLPRVGAKKKALKVSAVRRSRIGIRAIWSLTLTSAEARAEGRPVSWAAARSAASSRYRDRVRISTKLIA